MKIVVLDGHTLNPGDLSWAGLQALGDCTVYDRTDADQTVQRAGGAEILLSNKTVLSGAMLDQLDGCKYIGVLATGYNIIDIEAAGRNGIIVTNVPTYSTRSVAQMVFAHALNLTQHVGHHGRTVSEGQWAKSIDFCYWDYPLIELADKTMGIIGLGRIGQATAKLAQAFGMNVIGYDSNPEAQASAQCTPVELDELFASSDIVTLHCPLTDQTQGIVNADRLATMKPTAFLINTSRGPLVDQQALADALNQGRIAGAGLDVLNTEPPPPDNPLLQAKNCSITPHISWATQEARARLLATATENVKAFLAGAPQNVVNGS
jgi:glycerate dehydrogenase